MGCYQALEKLVHIVGPTLFAKLGFGGLHQLSSKEILLPKDISKIDVIKLQKPEKTATLLRGLTTGGYLVFGFSTMFKGWC